MNEALEKIYELCEKYRKESEKYERAGDFRKAMTAEVRLQCYEKCFEIMNKNKEKIIEEVYEVQKLSACMELKKDVPKEVIKQEIMYQMANELKPVVELS